MFALSETLVQLQTVLVFQKRLDFDFRQQTLFQFIGHLLRADVLDGVNTAAGSVSHHTHVTKPPFTQYFQRFELGD